MFLPVLPQGSSRPEPSIASDRERSAEPGAGPSSAQTRSVGQFHGIFTVSDCTQGRKGVAGRYQDGMNMSQGSYSSLLRLRSLVNLALVGLAMATAACAAQPTPPPVAAAPPSQAFQQASSPGAAEAQADDDVVFVDREHKEPTTHQDATPVTSLHADQPTARPVPHN